MNLGLTTVQWVIIAAFVLFLGLTVVAANRKETTLSNTLQDWGTKYNWFAYLWGVLIGHWFFPNAPHHIAVWPWLLIPMGLLAVGDVINLKVYPFPLWTRYPGAYVLLGIPSGMWLWGSWW